MNPAPAWRSFFTLHLYRTRNPRKSPLWRCAHRHFATFVESYPHDFQPRLGPLRPVIPHVVHKCLCALAHQSLTEYLRAALDQSDAHPALIPTLHTFGEYLDFHPHLHALVADGLFTRDSAFHSLPELPLKPLETTLPHPGPQAPCHPETPPARTRPGPPLLETLWLQRPRRRPVSAENKAEPEKLAQYILRNPFAVEKRPLESPTDLSLQVWHTDPLPRPVCQKPMRVIAVIDQREVVEKILRHLSLWSGGQTLAPARSPPNGEERPCTREPCADVNPMPDYENVLTD